MLADGGTAWHTLADAHTPSKWCEYKQVFALCVTRMYMLLVQVPTLLK